MRSWSPSAGAPVDECEPLRHRCGRAVAGHRVGYALCRRPDDRLGEKVGHVVLSRTVPEVDAAVADMFPEPVVDGPDVLCSG